MRDPKRIDAILARLRAAWMTQPDLRLGQLVMNAAPQTPNHARSCADDAMRYAGIPAERREFILKVVPPTVADPYYVEDEDLVLAIEKQAYHR